MARAFHTVTALPNGCLLVAGGVGAGNRALSSVQIYNPQSDAWTNAAAMNTARFQHAATLLPDGRVLVTGGLHRSSNPLSGGEIYTCDSDTWSPAPAMSMARYGHTLTTQPDGHVAVMGGCSTGPVSSMEIYTAIAENGRANF
jgi:N-acetylneuraminic acid mutarotase